MADTGEGLSPSSHIDGRKNGHGNATVYSNSNSNNVDDLSSVDDQALGSGLAAFFGDFLPYQNDMKGKPIDFSTGLSQLPEPTDPIKNANHIEANIGIKYTDGGLLYSEWRNKEKEYLTNYLMLRLRPHPDEDDTRSDNSSLSYSESSDVGESDDAIDPESQFAMDTQEPLATERFQSLEEGKISRKRRKRNRKNVIPYVEDCLHDLTKLEFLDLHARTLSLDISRIDKIWALRDTKRTGALSKRNIKKPVFESCSLTPRSRQSLQRLIFEEKEDDGPLATIYKKVVHFEIKQLHVAHTGGPGGVVGGPNDLNNKRQQRIKVFFYNSYATAISEWIQEQRKQSGKKRKHTDSTGTIDITTASTEIVMSFSNVPAACIFPYSVDPRNWREKQDLVDFCLCIGDRSIATTKKNQKLENNDDDNHIRFDSKEMEIRLMAVVTESTTSQKTTATGCIVTNNRVDDVDVSSELILSRRTLAKEFLSSFSSQGNTPRDLAVGEERGVQNSPGGFVNPLRKSWESYKNSRNDGSNISGEYSSVREIQNHGEATTIQQSTSDSKERLPLRQLDQQQQQHRTQFFSQKQPVSDGVALEPMLFEGSAQRRSDSKVISYVQLGDIANMVEKSISAGRGCNFKVNLYAAVVSITPPRKTKRGDWMVAATLIDESCLTPMTINIFCRKQDHLPKLMWMGDVIRIHRAAPEKWCEKIQLQGLKPTQYVVTRKIASTWKVMPTAQIFFTFNRMDESRSQALWRWANWYAAQSPTMRSEHCFTLQELQHLKNEDDGTSFENRDVTVMVVQKLTYQSSGLHPHGLLRVWDGTGNPPSDPLFNQAMILSPSPFERRGTTYPRAIEKIISISRQLQASIDNMEIPISLCGRVSNVVVWEKSLWSLIQEQIPIGTFLRLRNVHIRRWEANNFRSIFMHDKSWMTALPTNNYEVRYLVAQHNELVRRGGSNNYNREFSGDPAALPHLSACKFAGAGLTRFRDQEKARVYTGAVYILLIKATSQQMAPGAEKVVTVADRSGSLRAVATPKIHLELQNVLAEEASSDAYRAFDTNRRFLVTVRMIILGDDQQKHFVLTNLAGID